MPSAESSGKNEIKVMVELPTEAQRVDVYRDGVKVGSVFPGNTDENAFIDSTIPVQGNTYRYTCAAIIDGVERWVTTNHLFILSLRTPQIF